MEFFDLTLSSPAENLALDEALLDEAEAAAEPIECLRLWESPQPLVVVGRNSRLDAEVQMDVCRARGVPVLRRASGGCAIVAGPGCLMYAVVLSYERRAELRPLEAAHRFVLETILAGLRPLVDDLARQGTSDLTRGALKFSGNSLRCRRRAFLYHGTLLYDFPAALVAELLPMPPREPAYRRERSHEAFIANLPLSASRIKQALVAAWKAVPPARPWPQDRLRALLAEGKYAPEGA